MASCKTLMDNLLCTTRGDVAEDTADVEDSCSGLTTPSAAAVAVTEEEEAVVVVAAAGVAEDVVVVVVCSKILSMLQSCEKILAIRLGMSLLSTDIFRKRDIVWKK